MTSIQERLSNVRQRGVICEDRGTQDAIIGTFDAVEAEKVPLLIGQSGTGKDVFARQAHAEYRPERPFLQVNVSGIPMSMLRGELCGHARGAFTDANQTTIGHIGMARDGVLYFDELGSMDPGNQSLLLDIIERRAYNRIGDSSDRRVDACLVASSNKDGRYYDKEAHVDVIYGVRNDMLWRCRPVQILPLGKRKEDIIPLSRRYFAENGNGRQFHFTTKAEQVLTDYDYPLGNIRELQYMLDGAMHNATRRTGNGSTSIEIVIDDIHIFANCQDDYAHSEHGGDGADPNQSSCDELPGWFPGLPIIHEVKRIAGALKGRDYCVKWAASDLGISSRKLWRDLGKYFGTTNMDTLKDMLSRY